MQFPLPVRFQQWHCLPHVSVYADAPGIVPAIQLFEPGDPVPVACATVNIEDNLPPDGHCWIKAYSENVGMIEALEAARLIERTDTTALPAPGAYAAVTLRRITDPHVLAHIDDAYLEMRQQRRADSDDATQKRRDRLFKKSIARAETWRQIREACAKHIGKCLMASGRIDTRFTASVGVNADGDPILHEGESAILWRLDGVPFMMTNLTIGREGSMVGAHIDNTACPDKMRELFPDELEAPRHEQA